MKEELKKLIEKLEGYKHTKSYADNYSKGWNEAIEQAMEVIQSSIDNIK